ASMSDFVFTQYLFDNFDVVWPRVLEHLTIVGLTLSIALIISMPVGLLLSRKQSIANPVLGVLGVIYTIPSFALFAFLVPITGIGAQPAIIALVAYSLVVLVRNTMVGFNGVDRSVIEAAQGMGMNGRQQLWRIEVPLALPVIVAGMRIATLSTIGLTTIAAWIGAGGLGQLLKDGINNPSKLYAGVIAVGVMAIGADLLFRLLERQVGVKGTTRSSLMAANPALPKEA
ncbi:MAG: ABC transporter permease, partial [Chloroflexia bacterium]